MKLKYRYCSKRADAFYQRGFKGLKQAIKLEYKLSRYDKAWFSTK